MTSFDGLLNRNKGVLLCSGTPASSTVPTPQQQGQPGGSALQAPNRSAGAMTPDAAALARQLAQMLSSGEFCDLSIV